MHLDWGEPSKIISLEIDQDRARQMGVSSLDVANFLNSSISGAMRKLVSDGFVEKAGKDPIIYSLTEKGKEYEIDNN